MGPAREFYVPGTEKNLRCVLKMPTLKKDWKRIPTQSDFEVAHALFRMAPSGRQSGKSQPQTQPQEMPAFAQAGQPGNSTDSCGIKPSGSSGRING
jgi:hypothetical protein